MQGVLLGVAGLLQALAAAHMLPGVAGLDLFGENRRVPTGMRRNGGDDYSPVLGQRFGDDYDPFATVPRASCFLLGLLGVAPSAQALHDLYVGGDSAGRADLTRLGALAATAPQLYFQLGALLQDGPATWTADPLRPLSVGVGLFALALALSLRWVERLGQPPLKTVFGAESRKLLVRASIFVCVGADGALRALAIALVAASAGWWSLLIGLLVWLLVLGGDYWLHKREHRMQQPPPSQTGERPPVHDVWSAADLALTALLQTVAPHVRDSPFSANFMSLDALASTVLAASMALLGLAPFMPLPLADAVVRENATCAIIGLTTAKLGAFCFAVFPWCSHHSSSGGELNLFRRMRNRRSVAGGTGVSRRKSVYKSRASTRAWRTYYEMEENQAYSRGDVRAADRAAASCGTGSGTQV